MHVLAPNCECYNEAYFSISVTGSMATHIAGIPNVGFVLNQGTELYAVDRFGTVCMFLSFASNVMATSLIGWKAWYDSPAPPGGIQYTNDSHRVHRQILKETLSMSTRNSRALSLLSLLIESGTGYSLLWVRLPLP